MFNFSQATAFRRVFPLLSAMIFLFLTGCESSDDDDSDGTGFVQIYNISPNAPGIILTLNDDDEDDDDGDFTSFAVNYPTSTGFLTHETGTYDMELSWQDGDESDDLEVLYENQLTIDDDAVQLIVVAEDVTALNVQTYNIPVEDDDSDDTDEVFNLRVLNMDASQASLDIYYSRSDETINEAVLFNQANYAVLSDNQKIADDDYIFYLVENSNNDVVYQSDEMSFLISYQYLLVIRENTGAGSSPFTIDKLSRTNAAIEFPDSDAEAQLRVYNGIVTHELLPVYQSSVDVAINGIDNVTQFESLAFGEFSNATIMDFGDYSVSLSVPETGEEIIDNHLLSLEANSDKTIFFFLHEEAVDEDGDGDFDEDGDGYIDEYEITANSLVVENSPSQSIYTHQINVINLVDDFDSLQAYFVRNGETIETSSSSVTANYIQPKAITLANNTYKVYLIGEEDSSQLILASEEVIIDENTREQYLILEESDDSASGYQMTFTDQKVE